MEGNRNREGQSHFGYAGHWLASETLKGGVGKASDTLETRDFSWKARLS